MENLPRKYAKAEYIKDDQNILPDDWRDWPLNAWSVRREAARSWISPEDYEGRSVDPDEVEEGSE